MFRTSYCLLFACAALLFAVLFPQDACAWGPGVHMVTGNWILQNLAALPASVAVTLMAFPGQYLHGCLSADIFIGKGSKAKRGHSHNWESGFALLARADAPERLAYAYGYLSHLAADTVAHNVFVPGLFHLPFGAGRFIHVLLEAQADRVLSWDCADALSVFHEKTSSPAAKMLRSSMGQGAFPFWFRKQLFQGCIAVNGSLLWRRSMNVLDALVPERELHGLLERMLLLSARAIADVLRNGEGAAILSLDPIGAVALARAGERRRRAVRLVPEERRKPARRGQLRLRVKEPDVLARIPRVCLTENEVAG